MSDSSRASFHRFLTGSLWGMGLAVFIAHFFGIFALSKDASWGGFFQGAMECWWLVPALGLPGGLHSYAMQFVGYREAWKALGYTLWAILEVFGWIFSIFSLLK